MRHCWVTTYEEGADTLTLSADPEDVGPSTSTGVSPALWKWLPQSALRREEPEKGSNNVHFEIFTTEFLKSNPGL